MEGREVPVSGVWSGVYRQGGREVERKRSVEGRWYGTEGGRERGDVGVCCVRYARQCGTLTLSGTISDTCESRGAE